MSVFVSYSHDDEGIATKMVNALEAQGISCWIAPRNVNPGGDYSVAIDGALDEARVAVLVYSRKSLDSRYCKNEINTAFDNKAAIIPFKIDDSPVKIGWNLFLKNAQWIDAVGNPESKFDELADAIRSLPESEVEDRSAYERELERLEENEDRSRKLLAALDLKLSSLRFDCSIKRKNVASLNSQLEKAKACLMALTGEIGKIEAGRSAEDSHLQDILKRKAELERKIADKDTVSEMRDVYICYDHEDIDYANALKLFLDRCEYTSWPYAGCHSAEGRDCMAEVARSHCCIFIATARSTKSAHVRKILDIAVAKRVPIVALSIDFDGGMEYASACDVIHDEVHVAENAGADPSTLIETLRDLDRSVEIALHQSGDDAPKSRPQDFFKRIVDEVVALLTPEFARLYNRAKGL